MFYFFSRHENNKWSKVVMTPTGPLLTRLAINRATAKALALRLTPDDGRLLIRGS